MHESVALKEELEEESGTMMKMSALTMQVEEEQRVRKSSSDNPLETTTATATTTTTTSGGLEVGAGRVNEMSEMSSSQLATCCAGCQEQIRDKFIFAVIGLYWHQDCVQCCECSAKLSDRCYTFEGKLYCRTDYWRRFGPKCFACSETIGRSELVQRIKENRVYHLKCFTCNDCHKQLKAGEQLHLIDGKKLLCKQDYHHLTTSSKSSPASSVSVIQNNTNKSSKSSTNNNKFVIKNEHQQQTTYYTLMSSQQANQARADKLLPVAKLSASEDRSKRSDQISKEGIEQDEQQHQDDVDGEEEEEEEEEEEVGEEEPDDDEEAESVVQEEENLDLDNVEDQMVATRAEGRIASISRHDEHLAGLLGGFDNDNNLENEENHSMFSNSGTDATVGLQQSIGVVGANQLQQAARNKHITSSKKTARHQQQQQQQVNGAAKKRRRRRQKQMVGVGTGNNGAEGSVGVRSRSGNMIPAGKKLANRNGESILNGMGPNQTILSLQPASGVAQPMQQVSMVQQQQHHLNKSVSSSASTASNSSTSSSLSLGLGQRPSPSQSQTQSQSRNSAGHHTHHQHNLHQSQPQSAGAGPNTGGNATGTGGGHKPTRVRTVLNEKQLQTLRDCYACNPRPDALMKEQLVDMTGLSSRVIRVWFQNKRCKDKKKSILYKQMQQHEKDGRHLASLSMMRGVAMVASSPIQYDDHSTVSTPGGAQQQPQTGQLELQGPENATSPSLLADPHQHQHQHQHHHHHHQHQHQHQQRQHYSGSGSVHSPGAQPVDIQAYQPPWKNLIDYAHQQQPAQADPASPRYQQLMSQVHGYNGSNSTGTNNNNPNSAGSVEVNETGNSSTVLELQTVQQAGPLQQQQQQQQQQRPANQFGTNNQASNYQNNLIDHHTHHTHHHLTLPAQTNQAPTVQMQPSLGHLHQFQR